MSASSVVVVGAGPSGLVTAIGLRAAGIEVRVLDRARGPATTSRALGLQPRGVEVLDRLGALADLPDRALPIHQVVISVDGRELTRLDVSRPTPLVTRPGLMMSQAAIEAALRERLRALGGHIEWGRRITAGFEHADGITLTCADAEQLTADWVVGCDGAHSVVRSLAGIDFPGVPLGEQFMLADVHADLPLPRTAVTTCLRGDQIFAIFPLPGQSLWRLLASWPADDQVTLGQSARLDPDVVVARLTALLPQHTGFPASVIRDVAWASSFHIHRRLAASYRRGRFLLVGDAAHVHSPFGGQGMNTGMGDAENLAWKLALVVRGQAGAALLDTYEAERRPIAAEVLSSTTSMTRLMLGATPLARVARDRVVVPLMNRPVVQRRIREDASQLKVSYRSGPLGSSRRLDLRPGPRPGDRVPDLVCTRDDGSRTRLHAELGARWVLLDSDDATLSAVRRRLGGDAVVALRSAGGTAESRPGRAALVRPDGHLACGADEAADWLDTVLGGSRIARVSAGASAA